MKNHLSLSHLFIMINQEYDAVVIGGGFFGAAIALHLKKYFKKIVLFEKDSDLMQRASYSNQARVHNGYHYPRSVLTALRSHVNSPRFKEDYPESIVDDFKKYYAVGKIYSKVTANQYRIFCERIGSFIESAPLEIQNLFDSEKIEGVFAVNECAFDPVKLKNRVKEDLKKEDVEIKLNTEVESLIKVGDKIKVKFKNENKTSSCSAKHVFNCTYSQINKILKNSKLPIIPLKHEFTEMALVKVPKELEKVGITVMCGPFFSVMPFPPRKLHSLSHVRYTPHTYWYDSEDSYFDAHELMAKTEKKSNFLQMKKDAERYLPALAECEYVDSIWEVKTVLPVSENDDGRPILFKKDYGFENFHCVMGGKIDNIYDATQEIDLIFRNN